MKDQTQPVEPLLSSTALTCSAMAMGKLTTQEEGKLLKFISDLGITPQDALIFLSRHEIDMGEHQDLRSSLDELHKVHACLRGQSQGNVINLIKCKAELINMLALVELRQHQWVQHCQNFEKLRADVIKEELAEIRDKVLSRMPQQVTEDSQHADDSQVFGDSQQDDDSQVFGDSQQDDDSVSDPSSDAEPKSKKAKTGDA